jgi:hypothetical protein
LRFGVHDLLDDGEKIEGAAREAAVSWRFLFSARFWMTVYFAIGLSSPERYGEVHTMTTGGRANDPFIAMERIVVDAPAGGSIVVMTLFWPAVLWAGILASVAI